MGVPGLFSWVKKNYQSVVSEKTINHQIQFVDETCDHLYIDLNHVLHSCAHSLGMARDDGPLEGIFGNIEKYVDQIVTAAKPQSLVMIAVDGVAPKAKLAQQRTRRFLGAHRDRLGMQKGIQLKRDMENKAGKSFPTPKPFDRNIITPGTPFMRELTQLLHEYVDKRLKENDEWKNLKVLLSTANEPGEGEHKIVKFIRDQRLRKGYNPKTRHVVFGQDADLILLALMTHEPHFRIFREHLKDSKDPPTGELPDFEELNIGKLRCHLKYGLNPYRPPPKDDNDDQSQHPQEGNDQPENDKEDGEGNAVSDEDSGSDESEELPDFNFERTLEDFVLLSFLLGNDFLPSIPSLDIYDKYGGMTRILMCYKEVRAKENGFITHDGTINAANLQKVLRLLQKDECDAYRRIRNARERFKRKQQERDMIPIDKDTTPVKNLNAFERQGYISVGEVRKDGSIDEALAANFRLMTLEEKEEKEHSDLSKRSLEELEVMYKKRLSDRIDRDLMADADIDDQRLGSPGYEERYYIDISPAKKSTPTCAAAYTDVWRCLGEEIDRVSREMVGTNPIATTDDSLLLRKSDKKRNVKGKKEKGPEPPKICYAAWDWCYGYHYAPLIKDLAKTCGEPPLRDVLRVGGVRQMATDWTVNHGPVSPFVQLLSVLPPQSAELCLPRRLARLLKATERDSYDILHRDSSVKSLTSMFPTDLGGLVDARGKLWAHTVILRLPPVDYTAICQSASIVAESMQLTEDEQEGNSFNCADLYMCKDRCDELKRKSDEIERRLEAAHGRSPSGRFDWADDVDDELDPILEIVIPPFKDLVPADEEEEEDTVCLGVDIAGITSVRTQCSLLQGAISGDEKALKGTQFYIKERSSQTPATRPRFRSV